MRWTCVLWIWNVNRVFVSLKFLFLLSPSLCIESETRFSMSTISVHCCASNIFNVSRFLCRLLKLFTHSRFVCALSSHLIISKYRAHIPYCTRNAYFVLLVAIERIVHHFALFDWFHYFFSSHLNTRSKFNFHFLILISPLQLGIVWFFLWINGKKIVHNFIEIHRNFGIACILNREQRNKWPNKGKSSNRKLKFRRVRVWDLLWL